MDRKCWLAKELTHYATRTPVTFDLTLTPSALKIWQATKTWLWWATLNRNISSTCDKRAAGPYGSQQRGRYLRTYLDVYCFYYQGRKQKKEKKESDLVGGGGGGGGGGWIMWMKATFCQEKPLLSLFDILMFFFVLVFRAEAQEVCEQFEKVQNQDS